MINRLSVYEDAGRKSALARQQGDEACARFHASWARRAIALEADEDRASARAAFDDAYRDAARAPIADVC